MRQPKKIKLFAIPFSFTFFLLCSLIPLQSSSIPGYLVSSKRYGYSVLFPAKPQTTRNEQRKFRKSWKEFASWEWKDSRKKLEYHFESMILAPDVFKKGKYQLEQYFKDATGALVDGDSPPIRKEIREIVLNGVPGSEVKVVREVNGEKEALWLKTFADSKQGKTYNLFVQSAEARDWDLPEVKQFMNSLQFKK